MKKVKERIYYRNDGYYELLFLLKYKRMLLFKSKELVFSRIKKLKGRIKYIVIY